MKNLISILFIALSVQAFGFKRLTPQDYIDKFKDDAIKEMERSGVPASITLAQGMLESGYGNSELARKANNHFGIKCHSDWKGPSFTMDDDKRNECFRKYKSAWHSYRDHSDFLKGKRRYAFLFDLKITDYKGWAKGLRKAGYATNKKYAKLLIDLIERHDLNQFVTNKKSKKKGNEPIKEKKEKKKIKEIESDDGFEVVYAKKTRVQVSDNWIKFVEVKKGDTYYSISKETGIPLKRIYRYNECSKETVLPVGARLYLQPKKRKAKVKSYVFQEGDDLYRVSQKFGVKLKYIYKRNGWSPSYVPKAGERILLRGKKM